MVMRLRIAGLVVGVVTVAAVAVTGASGASSSNAITTLAGSGKTGYAGRLALPGLVAAASRRALLTVKCGIVAKTVCKVSEPIVADDNNQQLVVTLPGRYLGVEIGLSTQGSGVSFGDPHTLSPTKWVTTMFVPATVP